MNPGGEDRFRVYPGEPEIRRLWEELRQGYREGTLSGQERDLLERWAKAIRLLRRDPSHNSLRTHAIDALTRRYGRPVFQSYLDQSERARRIYWVYGPGRGEITVIGIEPHPDDTTHAYERIPLSNLPERNRDPGNSPGDGARPRPRRISRRIGRRRPGRSRPGADRPAAPAAGP